MQLCATHVERGGDGLSRPAVADVQIGYARDSTAGPHRRRGDGWGPAGGPADTVVCPAEVRASRRRGSRSRMVEHVELDAPRAHGGRRRDPVRTNRLRLDFLQFGGAPRLVAWTE